MGWGGGALAIIQACGLPSSGLIPCSFSIVSGTQNKPNEYVLIEAVKSRMRSKVYLQIMTWYFKIFKIQ